MPNVLIRNIDKEVVDHLKQRALRNDRSLQAELQVIIERAAKADIVEGRALAERIRRKLSGRKFSDSAKSIAADRRR